jgi:hypothetical protein
MNQLTRMPALASKVTWPTTRVAAKTLPLLAALVVVHTRLVAIGCRHHHLVVRTRGTTSAHPTETAAVAVTYPG